MIAMRKVSVIVPVYNEEKNVEALTESVINVFAGLPYEFELIFVDDGSRDNSFQAITAIARKFQQVYFIKFSRNFGKDAALRAGFELCTGDAAITLDADLQHPPALMKEMLNYWEQGFEIVYAFRETKNPHTGRVQKASSSLFYKLSNFFSGLNLEDGISDYRLVDRKVINVITRLAEIDLFFRGMLKWVGYKQAGIAYTPDERLHGETQYKMKGLVKLAVNAITSFSIRPLYFATYLGIAFSATSFLFFPYILYSYFTGNAVSGWTSLIATVVFFGGLQLLLMGIIGIYIGKTFMQAKQRPHYLIQETNF
jgi:dolichol-phosphate mannosyltransferase